MKPEIRAAADKELPPDHDRSISASCPAMGTSIIDHRRRPSRGSAASSPATRSGAVVGVDLAGRLFNRVPPTPR